MQEGLNKFERNNAWELFPKASANLIIGTQWFFRNKLDEDENILRNKVRLVTKGYNQWEEIDFYEKYAHIARLEAIRMLLVFLLHQEVRDVKSAFVNGYVQEKVFIDQSLEFINHTFPDHVFNLKKTLYGLKQALRAWYDRLNKFLL